MDRSDPSGVTTDMLRAHEGHFVLESGLHTDRWYALDALLTDPLALAPRVEQLSNLIRPYRPTVICGPMTGGALLAQAVASHMGLRFAWTQRSTDYASLALFRARYEFPVGQRSAVAGLRIALVDDMISAGSVTRATLSSTTDAGGLVTVIGTLNLMGDEAAAHFAEWEIPLVAVERHPFDLWKPADCPLCRRGEPVSTRAD